MNRPDSYKAPEQHKEFAAQQYIQLLKDHLVWQIQSGVKDNQLSFRPTGDEFNTAEREFLQWFGPGTPQSDAADEALRKAREEAAFYPIK